MLREATQTRERDFLYSEQSLKFDQADIKFMLNLH